MPPTRLQGNVSKRQLKAQVSAPVATTEQPKRSWIEFLRAIPRPTQEGLVWLLLASFLMLLRAFNLVTLIASFMFGAALVNWLALLMRTRLGLLQVKRSHDGPVFADQPCLVGITVTNPTPRTQTGLGFRDAGHRHEHVWGIPLLPAGEARTSWFQITLPRRGVYRWEKLTLSCRYPFGLFRRRLRFDHPHEIVVLPQLGTLHQSRLRQLLNPPPRPTPQPRRRLSRRSLAPADFYGVRDFRPGDSPRWIHWRTSARMGTPMVREFEETPIEHLIVIVDPWLPAAARGLWERLRDEFDAVRREQETMAKLGPRAATLHKRRDEAGSRYAELAAPLDKLEKAISLAATLCWTWHQEVGTDLALGVADVRGASLEFTGGLRGVTPLLETLSRIEGGPDLPHEDLLDRLDEAWLPHGAMVVVSTRATELANRVGGMLRRPTTLLNVSSATTEEYFRTDARARPD